jgi:hypothetical protein
MHHRNHSQRRNSVTISEYWQMHGYSKTEADQIEREQILEAMAQADEEAAYDAGAWNMD